MEAYPDSVSRVRPPNTTMPKTLAALPNNQYATLLELVLGKLLEFPVLLAAASPSTEASLAPEAVVAPLLNTWVDFHLVAFRSESVVWGGLMAGRKGELGHGRQTKRRLVRRGAAARSWGKAWNIEAIAMAGGGGGFAAAVMLSSHGLTF